MAIGRRRPPATGNTGFTGKEVGGSPLSTFRFCRFTTNGTDPATRHHGIQPRVPWRQSAARKHAKRLAGTLHATCRDLAILRVIYGVAAGPALMTVQPARKEAFNAVNGDGVLGTRRCRAAERLVPWAHCQHEVRHADQRGGPDQRHRRAADPALPITPAFSAST